MTELVLDGLTRTYGAARALDGLNLLLRAGEVHALMGENGAGKSTLIRLIAGLERADAGSMRLDAQPVRIDSPAAAQAAGLRFIHQELHVVPPLSVAENMHLGRPYPRRLGLVDWTALHQGAAVALDRLGVAHVNPRLPMSRLASGDQMLVRIAATLIGTDGSAPWLYVMDEPTAALTGTEAERLFSVIAELKAQGAGILYVSHRMAEVMRLSDRITVLRDGRHISTLLRADTDQTRLIHDMTGRDLSALFPPRARRRTGDTTRQAKMRSAMPLLVLDRISAGGLRDITLSLAAGEVLGIAGLAGAGRGALLRALIGAIPLTGGVLSCDGQPLTPTPAAAWGAGVAYVPRERRSEGLIPTGAVIDNVTLPHLGSMARFGLFQNRSAERRRLADVTPTVRLKTTGPGQPVLHLSGGNQQKVLFARAIAGRPKILLLDEPTRGVDVGARFDIYRLIRQFCDDGLGVIVASSDLPELIGLCDRIAVLQGGRLAHLVPNDGLTEAGLLALCYDSPMQPTSDRMARA